MGKKAKPIWQASMPQLDPNSRQPVTKGDLENVFFRLASATAETKSENREPTRWERSP